CKTPDWYDYSLCQNLPQPQTSNRFMGMTSEHEGIRTSLSTTLIPNHTYKLSFKFASGILTGHVRVYLTKFGPHWNANPNNSQNEKFEVDGAKGQDINNFKISTWFTKTQEITIPGNLTGLENI